MTPTHRHATLPVPTWQWPNLRQCRLTTKLTLSFSVSPGCCTGRTRNTTRPSSATRTRCAWRRRASKYCVTWPDCRQVLSLIHPNAASMPTTKVPRDCLRHSLSHLGMPVTHSAFCASRSPTGPAPLCCADPAAGHPRLCGDAAPAADPEARQPQPLDMLRRGAPPEQEPRAGRQCEPSSQSVCTSGPYNQIQRTERSCQVRDECFTNLPVEHARVCCCSHSHCAETRVQLLGALIYL